MKVQLLISCMHEKDTSIIQRSNVQSDVVVVNQCDHDSIEEFDFVNKKGKTCHAKFINTSERGLSRSRNMAIANASGDICLICDDDEIFVDNYEDLIVEAYEKNGDINCITFAIDRNDLSFKKEYSSTPHKVGLKQIMQTSSVQITFRTNMVKEHNIRFDTKLGSGSGNGAGEENKFLLDIKRCGEKIMFWPSNIGEVKAGKSLWFKGFTQEYMRNQGWSSRRSLGSFLGLLYILQFWIRRQKLYSKDISFICAIKYMLVGFFEKR